MQSRKSSILKPRKVREPLQDLNQLLPNNDDEETTTTDVQRRRVSFASVNKVKEFETATQCVTVVNAPPIYDKRFSLSTDGYQPSVAGHDVAETFQATTVSRKSIQNTFTVQAARQSIVDENIYIEEDVELTETIGRIYDIPMKSSGDSSMEMTHVITQTEIQVDEPSEEIREVGPLDLTKDHLNQTGCFADAHILEIEYVNDKNNEKDADTSSMETTEVITNNLIRVEKPAGESFGCLETTEVTGNDVIGVENADYDVLSMETTEVISPNIEKSVDADSSSMEATEVIYDNMLSQSLKSQSAFFETLQSSRAADETGASRHEEIEYVSIRNFESPKDVSTRKSIFAMGSRSLTNWENLQMCDENRENTNFDSSSMKLVTSANVSKTIADSTLPRMGNEIDKADVSVRTLSREVEHKLNITYQRSGSAALDNDDEEIKFESGLKTSTQEIDERTKYDVLSMQSLTQEIEKSKQTDANGSSLVSRNKTKCNNSNMELLSQEDAGQTKYNNSNVELLSQGDNKTKYNNSNMELVSQEVDKTKYGNSNMELLTQEDNKTKWNNSNMELLSQEALIETKHDDSRLQFETQEHHVPGIDELSLENIEREPNSSFSCISRMSCNEPVDSKNPNASVQSVAQLESANLEKLCSNAMADKGFTLSKIVDAICTSPKALNSSQAALTSINFACHEFLTETAELAAPPANKNLESISSSAQADSKELCDPSDVPHDATLRSSLGDDSSAGSNSPLTVGVNFSIFQKNKETRVEFSGTIDSSKKRKSFSNVKVNIINNKTENESKRVKELRFSMPATTKVSHEPETKKPDFSATFTDFSIPNEDTRPSPDKKITKVSDDCDLKSNAECPQLVQPSDSVSMNTLDNINCDRSNVSSTKPAKKRLSADAFEHATENEVSPKRRSLGSDVADQDADDLKTASNEATPSPVNSSFSSGQHPQQPLKCGGVVGYTEIKQRRESYLREEKSVLAIHDDVVVQTCSRRTNTSISYETHHCQMVTPNITSSDDGVRALSAAQEGRAGAELTEEGCNHNLASESCDDCSSNGRSPIDAAEMEDEAREKPAPITIETGGELVAAGDSYSDDGDDHRNASVNRPLSASLGSSLLDDDTDYCSQTLNPSSIIVNVGDSFSHYKSMDMGGGADPNVSSSDLLAREPSAEDGGAGNVATKLSPGINDVVVGVDGDDICKENLVVEWLQNKTGKTSSSSAAVTTTCVDNRMFVSSSDSNSTLSTVKSAPRLVEKPCGVVATICGQKKEEPPSATTTSSRLESAPVNVENIQSDGGDDSTSKQNAAAEDSSQQQPSNAAPAATTIADEKKLPERCTDDRRSLDGDVVPDGVTVVAAAATDAADEKMEINVDDANASVTVSNADQSEANEEENTKPSLGAAPEEPNRHCAVVRMSSYVEKVENKIAELAVAHSVSDDAVADGDARMKLVSDESELRDENVDENTESVTADGVDSITAADVMPPRSPDVEAPPKSTSKTRLSTDTLSANSEPQAEKRRKLSPEYVRRKTDVEYRGRSRDVLDSGGQKENVPPKKAADKKRQNWNWNRKFETTRRDVLEKIEASSKKENQKWKLKIVSSSKWIFQFFYDQLELVVEFTDDDESNNACNAYCQFVQSPYIKHYEISKIAVEYFIRKNESKLKKICRNAEDVPYMLKLIEPDVLYVKDFVADIFRLCDSEIFKIKNGRAIFYVYSFKKLMSAKIQINISRLEKLSVKDIQVEEIVGKADLNLIRNAFSEAGRDSDFFSKFLKKLWIVLEE